MSTCTGPACSRPARAAGLCASHYRQRLRGRPLVPLRPLPTEALVTLTIRVPPRIHNAARQDPSGARGALLAWAPRAEARAPAPTKRRLWRCTSCGGMTSRPRVNPGPCICGGGLVPGRWARR